MSTGKDTINGLKSSLKYTEDLFYKFLSINTESYNDIIRELYDYDIELCKQIIDWKQRYEKANNINQEDSLLPFDALKECRNILYDHDCQMGESYAVGDGAYNQIPFDTVKQLKELFDKVK